MQDEAGYKWDDEGGIRSDHALLERRTLKNSNMLKEKRKE
jgi:hypothetical protein